MKAHGKLEVIWKLIVTFRTLLTPDATTTTIITTTITANTNNTNNTTVFLTPATKNNY